MEDVMYMKFTTLEGRYLDTVEKSYIQKTENCVPINDKSTFTRNKIFGVIVKFDSK
jgi:hypothetical protein